jgi:hypothetical protein
LGINRRLLDDSLAGANPPPKNALRDGRAFVGRLYRTLKPYLIGVPAGLAVWIGICVAVSAFPPGGRPIAVFALGGTAAAMDAVIAAGGDILEVRNGRVIAISDDPVFVLKLYGEAPLLAVLAEGGCGFGRKTARQAA